MAYKNAELRKWNQRPFESALSSEAATARFAARGGKVAERTAVMCRWCGSVFVASADRIRKAGKSGEFYCDCECAGKHRSHLYKGNDAIHDPIRKARGVKRRYPHSKVHLKNCKRCGVAFFARNGHRCYCSTQCTTLAAKQYFRTANWVALKEKAKRALRPRQCGCCGVEFTPIKYADADIKCCSRQCQKKATRKAAKQVRRERTKLPNGVKRGATSLNHLMRKYKGMCVRCRCKCEITDTYQPNQATADHIVPLSKGGIHVEDNLQLMCHSCNTDKRNSIGPNGNLLLF